MTCVNIVDHRNHSNNPQCDAVLESEPSDTHCVISAVQTAAHDVRYMCKTTVADVIVEAQLNQDPVTVWLYDSGSISRQEVDDCEKS